MPVAAYPGPNSATGNGVTTVFAYSYRILAEADLKVYVDGTLKTLTTHYTVSGVGEANGGNVTFLSAPANGTAVVIARERAYTRATDYQRNGSFDEETVDADFDGLVMLIQQLYADRKRGFKAPLEVTTDQVLSSADWAARANRGLYFNASGNLTITTGDPDASAASATAAAASATAAAASATSASSSATSATASAAAALASETAADASADAAAASAAGISSLTQGYNYFYNGDFRVWGGGTATTPTGYTKNGSGGIAKSTDTTKVRRGQGVSITSAGAVTYLEQKPINIAGHGAYVQDWVGQVVTFGAYVWADQANCARLRIIEDGGVSANVSNSSYHAGDSVCRFISISRTINRGGSGAATDLQFRLQNDSTTVGHVAVYSGATVIIGSSLSDYVPGYQPNKYQLTFSSHAAPTFAAGTTYYISAGAMHTNDAMQRIPVSTKCVMRKLRARTAVDPSGSETVAFTLRSGGSDTSLTATVNGGGTSASDTTNEVEVAAGGLVNMKIVLSAGCATASQNAHASVECEEVPL